MSTERDPVCGMTVDSDTAVGPETEGGRNYYFCSETCRSRFHANPSAYLGSAASGEPMRAERHEPPHTTTGNFTAPKFGSAGSGGAEFEPLPEAHDDAEHNR
jgi:P-type Cu+ transporter